MRYSKDQKQATRQRILEAAGRRFKQDGIDGAGVAAVMSDAGLTNGAFYAHFTSKEDLVANVLADQLRAQRHSFDAQPRIGRDSKRSSAPTCLPSTATSAPTAAHRPRCSTRSPAAPPPPDRSSPTNCWAIADDIASRLDPTDAEAARTDALTLFGMMVGTLQLARALTDRDLSDQLLARGVETALKLIDDLVSSMG